MSNDNSDEMQVIIHEEKVILEEYFQVKKAYLQHQRFDGTMTPVITRYSYEKNDAVAALVYHVEKESILFVRQFRYPAYGHGLPWLYEIVAGGIDEGESADEAVRREVEEEAGYEALKVEHLHSFYVSPGSFSERIELYYVEVSQDTQVHKGGGVEQENEDLELVWIPIDKVEKWAKANIIDAKSLIGLYNILQ